MPLLTRPRTSPLRVLTIASIANLLLIIRNRIQVRRWIAYAKYITSAVYTAKSLRVTKSDVCEKRLALPLGEYCIVGATLAVALVYFVRASTSATHTGAYARAPFPARPRESPARRPVCALRGSCLPPLPC